MDEPLAVDDLLAIRFQLEIAPARAVRPSRRCFSSAAGVLLRGGVVKRFRMKGRHAHARLRENGYLKAEAPSSIASRFRRGRI